MSMNTIENSKPKLIGGVNVLFVMATRAEYLDELQQRFTPFICQVGPVEAAIHMGEYLATNRQINLVVSLGSGGSQNLQQAHVYQISAVSYRDMDASAFGFPKGETPFSGLPAEVPIGIEIPSIPKANLSTGANVVSGDAYSSVKADIVDMETWAILRACMKADVPMIGLRGISDGAEPVAKYSDWTRYLAVIDQRLASAVDALEVALVEGNLKGFEKTPR
ncbi:MAG: 5'-methylthioadenosine/S-adenosylhomocysteine nucleosidase [Rhizobiaceae bacterium]